MDHKFQLNRRNFLAISSALAASTLVSPSTFAANTKSQPNHSPIKKKKVSGQKPNILFIFTDQERHFPRLPSAFPLPGHQRLARTGTTFSTHQISSCMCTSSRSVMLTGLQTADNGMFENSDMPYVKDLSTNIPTFGHMLRKAGYYTAYQGKWHLNRNFEAPPPGTSLTAEMEKYGFSDFHSPGDQVAHELGAYEFDHMIAGGAMTWLRKKGQALNQKGTPWSLTVSLINPHDIMYFNADAPGENIQDNGKLLMDSARAPENSTYRKDWKYPLPKNLRQPVDTPDRPKAHAEYLKAWSHCLGSIPLKDENWNRFNNFYLNSIQSVDLQINNILTELDHLGLTENTIIIFTADHGEMAGAHGLRGKGPFAYKEATNVPMYIVHPEVRGGRTCQALTSHIDIVPTILSMAGVSKEEMAKYASRELPGSDMSILIQNDPSSAKLNELREAALFTYSGLATNDAELIRIIAEAKAAGKNPKEAIQKAGYKPNLKKRGSVRSVFDGRYKMSRYFAPTMRNSPKNLDELFANNDVELFDLKNDPEEMINLATDRNKNGKLLEIMNAKLEAAIAKEIGKDDGREMPNFPNISWAMDRMDL